MCFARLSRSAVSSTLSRGRSGRQPAAASSSRITRRRVDSRSSLGMAGRTSACLPREAGRPGVALWLDGLHRDDGGDLLARESPNRPLGLHMGPSLRAAERADVSDSNAEHVGELDVRHKRWHVTTLPIGNAMGAPNFEPTGVARSSDKSSPCFPARRAGLSDGAHLREPSDATRFQQSPER